MASFDDDVSRFACVWSGASGTDMLSVLCKRTYDLGESGLRLADEPLPLHGPIAPEKDGDQYQSTWQMELDVAPFKPKTDIAVFGSIRLAEPRPRSVVSVELSGYGVLKRIALFGDRRCSERGAGPPHISAPEPFLSLPLTYARAYGGADGTVADPRSADSLGSLISIMLSVPGAYPRNPAGAGFIVHREAGVEGLLLPNFEDPGDLLTPERILVGDPKRWHHQPLPQGLGWVDLSWFPRCVFGGALPVFEPPDTIREVVLGYLDSESLTRSRTFDFTGQFDYRLFNGASAGLGAVALQGAEVLSLEGVQPEGPLRVPLPEERPVISAIAFGTRVELQLALHTVAVLLDERQLYVVWRATGQLPASYRRPRPRQDPPEPSLLEGVELRVDWQPR